jgi:hypothetical protein
MEAALIAGIALGIWLGIKWRRNAAAWAEVRRLATNIATARRVRSKAVAGLVGPAIVLLAVLYVAFHGGGS